MITAGLKHRNWNAHEKWKTDINHVSWMIKSVLYNSLKLTFILFKSRKVHNNTHKHLSYKAHIAHKNNKQNCYFPYIGIGIIIFWHLSVQLQDTMRPLQMLMPPHLIHNKIFCWICQWYAKVSLESKQQMFLTFQYFIKERLVHMTKSRWSNCG